MNALLEGGCLNPQNTTQAFKGSLFQVLGELAGYVCEQYTDFYPRYIFQFVLDDRIVANREWFQSGRPENNIGAFLVRNDVGFSWLDYIILVSRKYSDSRKSEGCYAPIKSNSITVISALREIYNEKPEGNDEQKGAGQERNETAHFVSLPTEGLFFICLLFLFLGMISGSLVMAIVFGHMRFRNHESQ
jgi:hypothetical protein